jgi:hypothetical protein
MIFAPNVHLDPILCFYFVPFIAEASFAVTEMRMQMRVFMTTYILIRKRDGIQSTRYGEGDWQVFGDAYRGAVTMRW